MRLEVYRPLTFIAHGFDKTLGPLGVDVQYSINSTAAYITSITADGLLQAHNQKHTDLQIRPGDAIVAVNGKGGKCSNMIKLIGEAEQLDLTVARAREQDC